MKVMLQLRHFTVILLGLQKFVIVSHEIVVIGCVWQAYLCVCDMLIIFSHTIKQSSPQLEPLIFDAGKELQIRLTHFLNDKVFIEDDDGTNSLFCWRISAFYVKQNFLS